MYFESDPNFLSLSLALPAFSVKKKKDFLHDFPSDVWRFVLFAIFIEIEGKWIRDVFVHLSNHILLVLHVLDSAA